MITLLDIALLNCCTYSCDYCISRASLATAVNYECNGIARAVYSTNGMTLKPHILLNFLRNHFKPDECIIQLSGGEPLLHDAFVPICYCLNGMGYRYVINTNGNQLRSLARSEDIDLWKVKWRCSWHRDFRNMKKFKEDISPLKKENVLINYVAHPKRIECGIIEQDLVDLESSGYSFEVTPFQGKWNGKEYDKENKIYETWITAFKEDVVIPPQEVNYLSILPNGDINRCHKAKVGNIYENSIRERYPQAKQVCKFENGNSSCSLVQSLALLNFYINL
jgi:Molybdenum cofactor biosynthesis enzyme